MNAEEAFERSERQRNFTYGGEQQINSALDRTSPVKSAPISQAYSELDCSIVRLQNVSTRLAEVLQPVVGPSVPQPDASGNNEKAASSSALAESIRSDSRRIMSVVFQIENLLQRIEL